MAAPGGMDKLGGMNPQANSQSIGGTQSGAGQIDKNAKVNPAEFKQALNQAGATTQTQGAQALQDPAMTAKLGAVSAQMGVAPAKAALKPSNGLEAPLKFSSHAVERMRSRGISFSPDKMKDIEAAVGKAAQKGSKDTLVLTDNSALIVSVKNNTVVTVMDKNAMKENVFTNIDSTVMV